MNEMVERVARALCEEVSERSFDSHSTGSKDIWRGQAKVAIAAIREPTKLMCAVGGVVIGMTPGKLAYDRAAEVFPKMIDAALKE